MLVYAVNDLASYQELTRWKNEFLNAGDHSGGFPIIVVGNKSDEKGVLSTAAAPYWITELWNCRHYLTR